MERGNPNKEVVPGRRGRRGRSNSSQRNKSYNRHRRDGQSSNNELKRNYQKEPEHTMGFQFVKNLLDTEDLQQVILTLSNDRSGFVTLLDRENMTNDMIVLLVKLLWHVSECTFHQSKIGIYTMVLQSKFIDKVKLFIGDIINQNKRSKNLNRCFWDNTDDFWKHLISFCRTVIESIPMGHCGIIKGLLKHMTIFFPEIESTHSIAISDEIKNQTADLITVLEKTMEAMNLTKKTLQPKELNQDIEPPNDFKEIQIIPSAEEILSNESPFLRPNIIDKSFRSANQYLDIQFRLLREDFVAPIRRSIKTFLANQSKPKTDWSKLESVKIYKPVRFLNVESINEYYCYRIRFDSGKRKRNVSYEDSKTLMFGSLVCFTNDNFQHLTFGTIVQRDTELIKRGLVIVGFLSELQTDFDADYLMMESRIYFEPYNQVLLALKEMSSENFPMEKYIIKVEIDSDPPQYLRRNLDYAIEGAKFCPFEFPSRSFHNFNDSQMSAYKAALTNEFAIIQGPPGTGKTYLGLKVVSTLLDNQHAWYNNTPILVICYTNHALDQFLEGILSEHISIVRVGGQSKNEKLDPFKLSNLRRGQSSSQALSQKRMEVRNHLKQQKTIMYTLSLIEENESILNFKLFGDMVPDYCKTWFSKAQSQHIKEWLMEGTNGQRRRNDRRGQVNLQTCVDVTNEKDVDDLENPQIDLQDLDDVFADLKCIQETPLLTIQELKLKFANLNEELLLLSHSKDVHGLQKLLAQEYLEVALWQTETELFYLEYQLKYYQDPRNRKEANYIDLMHPFTMEYDDRWRLYFSWVDQYKNWIKMLYRNNTLAFRNKFQIYQEMQEMENTKIMREHKVVGMTTTLAARFKSSLQALRCPIVIVEEAAEVLESHIVVSLTKSCKHVILIGDHLQLKPSAADYRIETKYKLGISLFERMLRNNVTCHTLNVQHRMRPEICKLIKPHIYPDLLDHESTLNRAPILGVQKSLYFIDHQEPEEMCQDESKKNVHESTFLIAFARHLILNGHKSDQITILATYLGQMFEMRREKNKPCNVEVLKDVRIAVLDNYQGEECDIILLSLVRSNTANNIGFLRIQNRVCVALSRARNGLFIIGNMSSMINSNSENEIWKKINTVLEEQGAVGSHLDLRCQVHPFKLTKVSKSSDFDKLSEGGCDMICNSKLGCGHACKRLCHTWDRNHEQYKCIENCLRPLCNNPLHVCLKKCYEDCGPCTYLVRRSLDQCGHEVFIYCHINPAKYDCTELVHTKLPCEHEVQKACHIDPDKFICPLPCDTRVEPCGHACKLNCHIRIDPDHLEYNCQEPCARSKVGCRQDAEEKHICTNFCYQDCEDCTVGVQKLRSCGHMFKVQCRLDVEDTLCVKPCKLKLPCGHPCMSKCSEDCAGCEVKVEKTISECGHSVKINCSKTAKRRHCNSEKCPRLLPCGHKCKNRCKDQCTNTCTEIVDCVIESPCGHVIRKVVCHLKGDPNDPQLLLKHCTEPCNTVLKCKHRCTGTCGECVQSRFHKRCIETCGVPLLCNHKCTTPCRESCKPCTRQCEMRCPHSKCKKSCGAPCTPCLQKCNRKCVHSRCTMLCGQFCNVMPCEERCPKRLKCGHECVGFCGDPCPPLCRICNKEELTEIFFGNEDEEDAVFVLLNDCKHVLESTKLELWMNEGADQIQFKRCPKCTTNITTTQRYSDYVKQSIIDVSSAKRNLYGANEDNNVLRAQLFRRLDTLRDLKNPVFQVSTKLNLTLLTLYNRLKTERNSRRQAINKIELRAIESKIQVLTYIIGCFTVDINNLISRDPSILHLELILDILLRSEDHITNQEIDDLELEIKRLRRALQFDSMKKSQSFRYNSGTTKIKELTLSIEAIVYGNSRYSDRLHNNLKTQLEKLALAIKLSLNITDQERIEIVKAMAFPRGHWYKCPNGHPYCIANCGGAVHEAKCFCGEAIGGTQHRLLRSNQIATEMDGATSSAWPGPLY